MAGHSKWNNIKNRKGATDAKKAKIFGQLAKLIRVAVREGKSDNPQFNANLRLVLDKARAANMTKEKIQKAIDSGLGKSSTGASIQEVAYEGFGPSGVAFIVTATTDNPNRTSSEMKYIFSRNNGSLAGPGSAMYMFQKNQETQEFTPTMPMEVDEETENQVRDLIDALQANDDVEEIYTSAILTEEEIE